MDWWPYIAMGWGHMTVTLILLREIDTYKRRKNDGHE